MNTYIIVQFALEGIHRYLKAADEVDFLRNFHRHMFHIKFEIEVFHDDRELEFITVKRTLQLYTERWFKQNVWYSDISCEQIAKSLHSIAAWSYGKRNINVTVMEDDESGVIIKEQ